MAKVGEMALFIDYWLAGQPAEGSPRAAKVSISPPYWPLLDNYHGQHLADLRVSSWGSLAGPKAPQKGCPACSILALCSIIHVYPSSPSHKAKASMSWMSLCWLAPGLNLCANLSSSLHSWLLSLCHWGFKNPALTLSVLL